MKIAVGRYQNNKISLYSDNNRILDSQNEIQAVIISAMDCHIHIIPSKLKSDQQISAFIQHYIKTVHPGPYENLIYDYLLQGKSVSRKVVLVLMEKEIFRAFQSLNKPLYFFFQTDISQSFSFKAGTLYENYCMEKGSLHSITVEQNNDLKLIALDSVNIKTDKILFSANKRKKIPPLPLYFLFVLIILIIKLNLSLRDYNELKELYGNNQQKIEALAARQSVDKNNKKDLSELLNLSYSIKESKPINYYTVFSRMAEGLTDSISIKSIKFSGKNIAITGSTGNALKMINELDSTGLFIELKPSKIYPSEDNSEVFTMTGILR